MIKGPVPTLFASDSATVAAALKDNPGKAHADISKISKLFYSPEVLDIKEAVGILKKARYGK